MIIIFSNVGKEIYVDFRVLFKILFCMNNEI